MDLQMPPLVLCIGTKEQTTTLFTALYMFMHAWDYVTATTVANCFHHCSFSVGGEGPGMKKACEPGHHEVISAELCDALEEVSLTTSTWIAVHGTLTNEDIITQVTGKEPVVYKDEHKEEEAPMRHTTPSNEAIIVVHLFFSFEECGDDPPH